MDTTSRSSHPRYCCWPWMKHPPTHSTITTTPYIYQIRVIEGGGHTCSLSPIDDRSIQGLNHHLSVLVLVFDVIQDSVVMHVAHSLEEESNWNQAPYIERKLRGSVVLSQLVHVITVSALVLRISTASLLGRNTYTSGLKSMWTDSGIRVGVLFLNYGTHRPERKHTITRAWREFW